MIWKIYKDEKNHFRTFPIPFCVDCKIPYEITKSDTINVYKCPVCDDIKEIKDIPDTVHTEHEINIRYKLESLGLDGFQNRSKKIDKVIKNKQKGI